MAEKGDAIPEWGWGMALPRWVVAPAVVRNHAKNGRSSLSFRTEGLWDRVKAEIRPDDHVIIQFGHNDEKPDAARHTDPATTFRDSLRKYLAEARALGAHPVLATPVCRRKFGEDGRLLDTHGAYPDAVRAVAREEGVPLLDLQAATARLLEEAGPEGSKRFFMWIPSGKYANRPEGAKDDTHFVEEGALRVAELAVAAIKSQRLPLERWLR